MPLSRPQVKYMREVTPYFQKAMLLSDVGWEEARSPPFLSSSTMANGQDILPTALSTTKQTSPTLTLR